MDEHEYPQGEGMSKEEFIQLEGRNKPIEKWLEYPDGTGVEISTLPREKQLKYFEAWLNEA